MTQPRAGPAAKHLKSACFCNARRGLYKLQPEEPDLAKPPQLLHDAYLGAILIKGFDGAVEVLAGLVIAVTGPERIYEWVFKLTAPELGGSLHPALHAIRIGAAKLANGPQHFVIVYLVVHGLLKLGVVLALLRGTARWIFPVAALILTGFIAYMGWRLSLRWSNWLLGAALFDLLTLGLVLNEWRAHPSGRVIPMRAGTRPFKL